MARRQDGKRQQLDTAIVMPISVLLISSPSDCWFADRIASSCYYEHLKEVEDPRMIDVQFGVLLTELKFPSVSVFSHSPGVRPSVVGGLHHDSLYDRLSSDVVSRFGFHCLNGSIAL